MGLSEDIVGALREKYRSGATFAELAKSSGVSLTYLRSLTIGERDPMKLSLDFFLRLFPSAQIELAPARVPDDSVSETVLKSEYQALRDKYQDLRDKYQDLREDYLDLKSPPSSYLLDGPGAAAPYRLRPEPASESTLSPSNK